MKSSVTRHARTIFAAENVRDWYCANMRGRRRGCSDRLARDSFHRIIRGRVCSESAAYKVSLCHLVVNLPCTDLVFEPCLSTGSSFECCMTARPPLAQLARSSLIHQTSLHICIHCTLKRRNTRKRLSRS